MWIGKFSRSAPQHLVQAYRELKAKEYEPTRVQQKNHRGKDPKEIFRSGPFKGQTTVAALNQLESKLKEIYDKKADLEAKIRAATATAGAAKVDAAEQCRVRAVLTSPHSCR